MTPNSYNRYTLTKVWLQSSTDTLCQQAALCEQRTRRHKSRNTRGIKCGATWQCLPHAQRSQSDEYLSKTVHKSLSRRQIKRCLHEGLRAGMGRLSDSIRSTAAAASSVASTIPVAPPLTALISNLRRFIVGSGLCWCVVPLLWLTRSTYYHTEQVRRYFVAAVTAERIRPGSHAHWWWLLNKKGK